MIEARRTFGRLDRRLRAWKSAWTPLMLSGAASKIPIGSWWPMWRQRPWSDGQKVSIVYDEALNLGGTGRIYTQATVTEQPTWLGGQGTPYFDGGDHLFRTGTTMDPSAQSRLLMWAVVGRVPQAYSETIFNVGGWSPSVGYKFGRDNVTDSWELWAGNGYTAGNVGVKGARTQDVAYLVAGIDAVSGGFMRENGVDRTNYLVNGAFPARASTTGYIGRSAAGGGERWVGAIAELGYVAPYTDQDVEQLEAYLKSLYGF